MSMTYPRLILLLSCLLLLYRPAATAAAASPKPDTVHVAYQPFASPAGALFEVIKRDRLLHQGLERQGLKLQFTLFLKGSDAFEGLRNKSLDITTMGEMPLLEASFKAPLTVIGQHKQNYSSVVTQRGLQTKDLKGKRIGNAFASSGHFTLLKTLKNAGMTERDVTLVQMDVTAMPEALLSGKIDAFAAWEPTTSLFVAKHPDRFSSLGRQSNSAYLVCERAFAAQHPGVVAQFAAAMARAMHWLSKGKANQLQAAVWNLEAMQKLSGKPVSISQDELAQQLNLDLQAINYSARLPAQTIKPNGQLAEAFLFLKQNGRLPQSAQWEQVRTIFRHDVMDRVYRKPALSGLHRCDYEH